jgi:hypothetical protein
MMHGQKKIPVHLTWRLLRAACPNPRLKLKFEIRPSWYKFHDTLPTGTAPDTIHVLKNSELKHFKNIQDWSLRNTEKN